MSITSEELNYLVWRYLQETGNELTALALQEETRVLQFESSYGKHIPVGTLVNLVQKGILYTESELLLENCEFADESSGKSRDEDQALRQKFNENFNLVDALRVDKEKYPEIKQSGRFALAHSGESSNDDDNDDEGEGSKATIPKTPIPMTLVHEFVTQEDTNDKNSDTDTVITVTNSMWNPVNPTLVCLSENDSTSKIYRIEQEQEQDDDKKKLVCQLLAKLKHPFALSSKLSSSGDSSNTTNEITAIAWSHNGELLVTGVENGEIRLWNKHGILKNVFSLHEYPIVTLSWNPDSTFFVSLDIHNVAILWNAITGTVVRHYPLLQRARSWAARFMMGGKDHHHHHQQQYKYRHSRSHINGNDSHSSHENRDLNGAATTTTTSSSSSVSPLGYNETKSNRNRDESGGVNEFLSSNETQLFGVAIEWIDKNKFVLPSVNGDMMVYQTDDEEDEPLGRLSGHQGPISCLAYNESNRMLLSASDDMTIRLWYGGNSNAVNCLYGHSQTIVALDWIDDAASVISSSMDGTVRVWSVDTGVTTRSESSSLVGIRLFDGIPIFAAELSHDRRSYCVGLMDGKVYVLDLEVVSATSSSADDEGKTRSNTPVEIPVLAEYPREEEPQVDVDMTEDSENRQGDVPSVSVYSVSWSSNDTRISVVYSNGTCSVLEVITERLSL